MKTLKNTKQEPSRQCPCGCGTALFPYNDKRPLVCYATWKRVSDSDKAIIMSPVTTLVNKQNAARRVFELARTIKRNRPDSISKGDKVSFVLVRSSGGGFSGFRFSAREGIVEGFNNLWVQVKYRGRIYEVARSEVRAAGEKNALTELIENIGSEEAAK